MSAPATASRERKRLFGRTARSGTTMHTGCAVIMGLPFLAIGTFILLVAAGRIGGVKTHHAPPALILGVGVLFAAAGLLVVTAGIGGMIAAARVRRRRRERPDEPWYWDSAWSPDGTITGGFGELVEGWVGVAFFALFLVPFNWIGYTSPDFVWIAITGLFDLILLLVIGVTVYQFARWIRYGSSRLRFPSFPFFLGGPLEVYLEGADRLRSFRSLTVTLRCIQEVYEYQTGSRSGRGSMRYVPYQIYEDKQNWTPASSPGDQSDMRIVFALPDEAEYETWLRELPPRYWELEITADTPGIDYKATFLVPVYKSGVPSAVGAR